MSTFLTAETNSTQNKQKICNAIFFHTSNIYIIDDLINICVGEYACGAVMFNWITYKSKT